MPWLDAMRGLQRILIVVGITAIVGYLAITGNEKAIDALIGAFLLIVGFLYGERARSKADG